MTRFPFVVELFRATDSHLILRPHEEPGVVVLDAAVRSWPPIEPFCLRWKFPIWERADECDPKQLKQEYNKSRRQKKDKPVKKEWTAGEFAEQFMSAAPDTRAAIVERAVRAGMKAYKAEQLVARAEGNGDAFRWIFGAQQPHQFATIPQPQPVLAL